MTFSDIIVFKRFLLLPRWWVRLAVMSCFSQDLGFGVGTGIDRTGFFLIGRLVAGAMSVRV